MILANVNLLKAITERGLLEAVYYSHHLEGVSSNHLAYLPSYPMYVAITGQHES